MSAPASSSTTLNPDAIRRDLHLIGVYDSFGVASLALVIWELLLLRRAIWAALAAAFRSRWNNHRTAMLVAMFSNLLNQVLSALAVTAARPPHCNAVNIGVYVFKVINMSSMLLTFNLRLASCISPKRWILSALIHLFWLAATTVWVVAAVATVKGPILPEAEQPMQGFWDICWKPPQHSYWAPADGLLLAHTGTLALVALALRIESRENEDIRFMTTQSLIFFVAAFVCNLLSFLFSSLTTDCIWKGVALFTSPFNTILAARLVYATNRSRILSSARFFEVRLPGSGGTTARHGRTPEQAQDRKRLKLLQSSSLRREHGEQSFSSEMGIVSVITAADAAPFSSHRTSQDCSPDPHCTSHGHIESSTSGLIPCEVPTAAKIFPKLSAQKQRAELQVETLASPPPSAARSVFDSYLGEQPSSRRASRHRSSHSAISNDSLFGSRFNFAAETDDGIGSLRRGETDGCSVRASTIGHADVPAP